MPEIIVSFNIISLLFLTSGFIAVKLKRPQLHQKLMAGALGASVCFLTTYVIYHYNAGSVPYPFHDWTRPVYFAILIPHIILAAVIVPFIARMVTHAIKGRIEQHKKLARWVWPAWMFVSITGILVYLMLYRPFAA